MKKVMIVDDEVLVRVGIRSLIPWEEHGYQIVCDASDGGEALEKIERHHPDIVLTDLMMSPTDGFELIAKSKEKYPGIQFIVLSSYNDFDNVRAAMKLGAFDYIFKLTVRPDELLKVMGEAGAYTKAAEPESGSGVMGQRNLDAIKKKLIGQILNSEALSNLSLEEMKRLPLNVSFDVPWRVLSVRIDNFRIVRKRGDFMDLSLLLFTMENILEELFNRAENAEVFQHKDYDFILVLNCEENQAPAELEALIHKGVDTFRQYARQYYGIEISAGMSGIYQGIEFLKDAVEETGHALEQRFWGETGTLCVGRKEMKEKIELPEDLSVAAMERMAMDQDWRGTRNYLERLLSYLQEERCWIPMEVRHLLRRVYRGLSVAFARCRIDIDRFTDRNGADMESAIYDYTFLTGVCQAMFELFEQYVNEYESNHGKGCRKEITQVKSFVQTHMKEELSLPAVAAMVNMSESHFSHIFKKETGNSFLEYVCQIRIDRAKYLLKTGDLKINEIAEAVGIGNPNYFSTQFKKRIGKSPLEYRQDYISSEEVNRRI